MRGHLFLSTLFAVSLVGGVALAEKPDKDHADRAKPQKENVVRERTTRAPMPERVSRLRSYGEVERVSHAKSHSKASHGSEATRQMLERKMSSKFESRGNCSTVSEECRAHSSSRDTAIKTRVDPTNSANSYLAREREKLREQYIKAMLMAYAMKATGNEGK